MKSEKSYEGIGGWLILVTFALIRAPIAVVVTLVRSVFPLLRHDTWMALTTQDSESYNSLWAPLIVSELVVNLVFLALSLIVLILFFRHKRSFPKFVIAFYLANLIWEICLTLVMLHIPATSGEPATSSLVGAIGLALACAIWIPYFCVSKRVRTTFTR